VVTPLAHLTTDKPAYQPGERVWIRALLLQRLSLVPFEGRCLLQVVDPKGAAVGRWWTSLEDGVASQSWSIPTNAAGRSYRLQLRAAGAAFTAEQLPFLLRRYPPPRLAKEITLDRETYAPGEVGTAEVKVERVVGGIPAGASVRGMLVLDGEDVWHEDATLDARGRAVFRFTVPTTVERGEARFLARVVEKIHTQRDDLGSVGEVFDRAFERRLVSGEGTDAVLDGLERDLDAHRGAGDVRAAAGRETKTTPSATEWTRGEEERLRLEVLRRELDLSADSLRETLEVALDPRRSLLDGPSDDQTFKLRASNLPSDWTELIDENLRARAESSSRRRAPKGTLNRLLFDGSGFLRELTGTDGSSTGRRVFRPDPNVALMHLGHPIVHRALGRLASFRFPGTDASQRVSRWTVSRTTEGRAPIPQGADALVLLTVEELAVNELRETFHHWVRAIALPATNGAQGWELGSPLPHRPAAIWHASLEPATDADDRRDAEGLWLDVERDLKGVIHAHRDALQSDLESALAAELETARTDADKLFASRQGELSSLIQTQTLERLEKQIADTRQRIAQPELFDREAVLAELERDVAKKEEEIARRKSHWESLRKALEAERDRVLDRVLPARHTLHDDARVFPVGVEIVLPGASS